MSKLYKVKTINFAFLYRLRHSNSKSKQASTRFDKRRVKYYCGYSLKTNKFVIEKFRYNDSNRKTRRTYRYYV